MSASKHSESTSEDSPLAQTALTTQRVVIRDMTLTCSIGLSDEERARSQRLRLNFEIDIQPSAPSDDEIAEVVHYGHLVSRIRRTCLENNVRLLETLADQILETCFFDKRVISARVRIEKLDRYPDVGGIGIEIERQRKSE
ncbi:dihydroneopterin aldolase [Denitrobaculum tricleocarpae]|uniref:dihydroneopterin aldolase n=1 Tax=Denitrobaculum tricleocarpae TaxID=2591009 RepID=A0A545U274_9PROT|nr:dihydroneopterin aldolase [Denitrobaculum tricleocarpae]TQV83571.1 dihydroneopterin aldolase [Denitrobaculum tricleocarpae]